MLKRCLLIATLAVIQTGFLYAGDPNNAPSGGPPAVPGDFDMDGDVDCLDRAALLAEAFGGGDIAFDYNGDGTVDLLDLNAFDGDNGLGAAFCATDFNGDGTPDCNDLRLLQAEVQAGTNNPAFDLGVNCDLTGCDPGDGLVNQNDINLFVSYTGITEASCVPPTPTGACCLAIGFCIEVEEFFCRFIVQGDYRGDNITCDPNLVGGGICPQPMPTGACCAADGTCAVITAADCNAISGAYQGDNTDCNSSSYAATPDVAIPDANPAGVTSTINVPASFTVQDLDVAIAVNHTWFGDFCVTLRHENSGAEALLIARPGGDNGVDDCYAGFPNGCPSSNWDLTLDDEGIDGDIENACGPTDGNVPAGSYVPFQALSVFDGLDAQSDWTIRVSDNTQGDIGRFISWSLHFDGGSPCPPPIGACCLPTGACVEGPRRDCNAVQGAYQGDQTTCDPNLVGGGCPQPTGACCMADGSCAITTAADCNAVQGAYQGDGTDCDPNITGSGVPGDGIPDVYYWTAAGDGQAAPNGEIRSAGTLLLDTDGRDFVRLAVFTATDFTAAGTCILCDGSMLPPNNVYSTQFLASIGVIWLRTSPLAGPGPIGIFDLADDGSGAATFTTAAFRSGDGTFYDFNVTLIGGGVNCPQPTGACCMTDGSCAITTAADCNAVQGAYQGDDTTCDPNLVGGGCPQPIVIDCPNNVTVECGAATDPNALGRATATGGQGMLITSFNDVFDPDCGATGTITRTWTATDTTGATATCDQIITIEDTIAPTITRDANDLTVECDGAGNSAALAAWLANNAGAVANDGCGAVTWSNDFNQVSDDCGATGMAAVTFTATDDCGLTSSTTATFTIEDTTAPNITRDANDLTVECDGAGNAADLSAWLASNGGAEANDVCGGVTWSNDFNQVSDDCGATGAATVIFTATDACGLTSTTTATFTIEDTTAPNITRDANNLTIDCDGAGNSNELAAWLANNGGAEANDVCGGVTWSNDFNQVAGACGSSGTATVVFTATDDCGLTSSTTATFTIEDATAPNITRDANDLTVECDGAGNAADLAAWLASNAGAEANDTCGAVTWSNDFNQVSDDCGATGMATVTFTATDDCGLTSTTTATFTIEDTTKPVITDPNATGGDVDGNCVRRVTYSAVIVDQCGLEPNGVDVDYTTSPNGTADANSLTIVVGPADANGARLVSGGVDVIGLTSCPVIVTFTINAADDCGNDANTVTVSAEVNDRIEPNLTVPPDITVYCHDGLDPNVTGQATAVDNCDPNVTITFTDDCNDPNTPFRHCRGKIFRTWTATDDCGNATSGVQVINVVLRGTTEQKGSLLILPKIEQRYNDAGALIQDTFITLSNDGSRSQHIKGFYVDGDTWLAVDFGIVLTPDEPFYWSCETPSFTTFGQRPRAFRDVLGGNPPAADPLGRAGTTVRGFLLLYATDGAYALPQRNNRLAAKVTIVNYEAGSSYEYDAYAWQAACVPDGRNIDRNSLMMGGDYDYAPGQVLADMFADFSEALGGLVTTELTLMTLDMDFRLDGVGPATTQAFFTTHKQDEVPLTWNQDYCITCWDSTRISDIRADAFNGSLINADRVKARIETFRNDELCGVLSRTSPLIGLTTKTISFATGATAQAASTLTGQSVEEAVIIVAPPGQGVPGSELTDDDGRPIAPPDRGKRRIPATATPKAAE